MLEVISYEFVVTCYNVSMRLLALFPTYIVWHYTRAISDFKRIMANSIWFVFSFFSMGILLKTLISPWRRLSKDENLAEATFFTNLVINVLMRLVGLLVRSITIILGLFSLVSVTFIFILGFFVWLLLPFLVPTFFLYGVGYFL